ncbi:MAG TPA: DNA-binding response regulator [Lactobacillus sp.]|nr:DNA-binding response regulator [Lactobacillus sp.]
MLRVLIADDHAVVRSGLKYLIGQQPGLKVVGEATTGTEASLRVEEGDIDILIMDLSMPPGENGLVTTKRLHDSYPRTKIVILSMHDERVYITQAIKNGAMAYVLKSSPDSEVVNALNAIMNGKKYLDHSILMTTRDLDEINPDDTDVELRSYQGLSNREREVLPLVALGYSNKEIAGKLFISTKTVEAHKANIMRKLDIHAHVDLVRYAVKHHLIDF